MKARISRRQRRLVVLLCPVLGGLGATLAGCSPMDNVPGTSFVPGTSGPSTSGSGTGSSSSSSSGIGSLTPAQVERTSIGLTDLAFERYDIAAGLSYAYGFSVGDYDGTGKPAIGYFDSYSLGHSRMRTQTGAIGHMVYNTGENDIIYPQETFPDLTSLNPAVFLLERTVPIDVNGDGKLDLAGVANAHSGVVAYINPGTHNTVWGRHVLSSVTPGPVNLTVADVNGDGLPDLIVAMRYQPTADPAGATIGIAWLENTGLPTGEWIFHPIDTTPANWGDPRTVQAADINGDGKIDVVTTDAVTGTVAWYEQGATPDTWTRHVIAGVNTMNAHFGRVVDMNGDGMPDILIPVTAGVSWLENVNHGQSWIVHPIVQFTDPNWTNIVTEVTAGNLHNDGTTDIVFSVGHLASGYATVRSGGVYIARASSTAWTVTRVYQAENNVSCLDLIDLDGTGVMSVISNAEYQQNGITVWQNQTGLPGAQIAAAPLPSNGSLTAR
jgi:hypothetical protein